jgi:hypothetical protein
MRLVPVLSVALLLVVATGGCESRTTIPAGAQQVRVTTTPASVHVTPATARAGEVYFVLDSLPQGVVLAFVRSSAGAGGALTAADLARLAQNEDAAGLSSEIMDISCCGNVYKKTLEAGTYALVVENPQVGQPGLRPVSIAVIDVRP